MQRAGVEQKQIRAKLRRGSGLDLEPVAPAINSAPAHQYQVCLHVPALQGGSTGGRLLQSQYLQHVKTFSRVHKPLPPQTYNPDDTRSRPTVSFSNDLTTASHLTSTSSRFRGSDRHPVVFLLNKSQLKCFHFYQFGLQSGGDLHKRFRSNILTF